MKFQNKKAILAYIQKYEPLCASGGVNVNLFPAELIKELQLEAKVMVFQGIVKIL